jgi:hypothetical protein
MTRFRLLALFLVCLGALAAPAGAAALAPLSSFGSYGEEAGQMRAPGSLDVAADGTIYVADYGNDRIDVFSAGGGFLRAFGLGVDPAGGDICVASCQSGALVAAPLSEAGGMDGPEDLALGGEGNVFVADVRNNRVDVFTAAGAFIRAFGSEVEASAPFGDVCTAASGCATGSAGPEAGAVAHPFGIAVAGGQVYVSDAYNNRIDVFSPDGTFIRAFGKNVNAGLGNPDVCTHACESGDETAVAGAMYEPFALAFGPDGDLYVTEFRNDRVDAFDPDGTFLFAFGKGVNPEGGDVCTAASKCQAGTGGNGSAELFSPIAVAVEASGNVLVGTKPSNRVNEYSPGGTFTQAFGEGVIDGAPAFQVCTICIAGSPGPAAGAVTGPYGLAVGDGKIYTVEEEFSSYARIQVFADPTAPGGPGGPESAPKGTAPPPSAPPAPAPSNRFRFGALKLDPGKGTATLAVALPGPGSVTLGGKGIAPASARAARATTVTLTLRPTGKAKRALRRRGKVKLAAEVTFTPSGGTPGAEVRKLTLRKRAPARRTHAH